MLAFLLGGALSVETLRAHGRAILLVSLSVVAVTLAVVTTGLATLGLPLDRGAGLGVRSQRRLTRRRPMSVLRETGADTGFTRTLKGIVAIDDAWGLISLQPGAGDGSGLERHLDEAGMLGETAYEILGSLALGAAIGFPAARPDRTASGGEPLRIEALGLVFLTAGLSLWLELSYLISGMTVGAIIVNRARHRTMAFHEIENIQWPFMVIFFILAGATLDLQALATIGPIGAGYMVLRILARIRADGSAPCCPAPPG